MKKLLSILLILGMLLSLAPMALASEDVADEPEEIAGEPVIEEEAIDEPVIEEEIIEEPVEPIREQEDEPVLDGVRTEIVYKINHFPDVKAGNDTGFGQPNLGLDIDPVRDEYYSSMTIDSIQWHVIWGADLSRDTKDNGVYFNKGNIYYCDIDFSLKVKSNGVEEYQAAGTVFSAEANGVQWETLSNQWSGNTMHVTVRSPYYAVGFDGIVVLGIRKPEVGKYAVGREDLIVTGTYSVADIRWQDKNGNVLALPFSFKAGEEYQAVIELTEKTGRTITMSQLDVLDVRDQNGAELAVKSRYTTNGGKRAVIELMPFSTTTVQVTFNGNGGRVKSTAGLWSPAWGKTVTAGQPYGTLPAAKRDSYTFVGWYTESSGGTQVTVDTVCTKTTDHILYAHWTKNEEPEPGGDPTLTISSDAKSAKATNFDGLFARVALILDNNGVSGLYITQATINTDGTILIPEFKVPGLKVKGVNVSLVPTLADIQSSTPNVKATASKML